MMPGVENLDWEKFKIWPIFSVISESNGPIFTKVILACAKFYNEHILLRVVYASDQPLQSSSQFSEISSNEAVFFQDGHQKGVQLLFWDVHQFFLFTTDINLIGKYSGLKFPILLVNSCLAHELL